MEKWAEDFVSIIHGETKKVTEQKFNQTGGDFVIGIVEAESPLIISDGPEIIILQEDLYILASTLANYERTVEYEQENGTSGGKLRFLDTFKRGDKVALIPSSGTKFILLGKVVQL